MAFTLRLENELHEKALLASQVLGISLTDFIRDAIAAYPPQVGSRVDQWLNDGQSHVCEHGISQWLHDSQRYVCLLCGEFHHARIGEDSAVPIDSPPTP